SFSMGSALLISGLLRDAAGWQTAWAIYCGLLLLAAVLLFVYRAGFKAVSDSRNATRSSTSA
ncbi:MAG TPA: hypothetical protein VGX52_01640, partial [Burkholderiales bacterium]|nr:hypothetical protein [Burkholderiales bacterium]